MTPEEYQRSLTLWEELRIKRLSGERPTEVRTDLVCADCGHPLTLRLGRYGRFYGCAMYHETGCKGSISADDSGRPKGWPGNAETRRARKRLVEFLTRVAQLHEEVIQDAEDVPPGPNWAYRKAVKKACTILGHDPEVGLKIGELSQAQCIEVLDGLGAPPETRWDRLRLEDRLENSF